MKILRKIIEIDENLCDGCGQCIPACEEGAIEIINGKARLIAEKYCDGLGACLGNCPNGALKIVEREADDFDEALVEKHIKSKGSKAGQGNTSSARTAPGCPSSRPIILQQVTGRDDANNPVTRESRKSSLGHWPIQIRLISPETPFLKNSHLLITADCATVAYPDFHSRLVCGRVVMMGCPKFDDQQAYVEKFTMILKKNDIRNITCVFMEVPCCAAMPRILEKALNASGKNIPVQNYIVSPDGRCLVKEGK